MKFKKGVTLNGAKPELIAGLMVADVIYNKFGEELVVTSVTDGKHSPTSLHYVGYAADLRTNYFNDVEQEMVVNEMKTWLTDEFDVVLEKTHIHLEFQPKKY